MGEQVGRVRQRIGWLMGGMIVVAVLGVGLLGGGGSDRAAAQTNYSVTLVPGWNTVTYVGEAMPPAQALAPVAGSITRALTWDAAAQSWQTYDATRPFLSTLTEVRPFDALFLFATGSATWTQSGAPANRVVPLQLGWNLVSWSAEGGATVSGALAGLPLQAALRYQSTSGAYQR